MMSVVGTSGWRTAGVWGALLLASGTSMFGCAKRPSSVTEQPKVEGFYLDNGSIVREDAERLDFTIRLVGSRTKDTEVYFRAYGISDEDAGNAKMKLSDGSVADRGANSKLQIEGQLARAGVSLAPGLKPGNFVDFGNQPGTYREKIVFAPGQTSRTVSIQLVHNGYYEHHKIIYAELQGTGITGAPAPVVAYASTYAVILNVDPVPTVTMQWDQTSAAGFSCSSTTCDVQETEAQPILPMNVVVNGVSQEPIEAPLYLLGDAKGFVDYILFKNATGGTPNLQNILSGGIVLIPSFGGTTKLGLQIIDDALPEAKESLEIKINAEEVAKLNGKDAKVATSGANIIVNIAANDAPAYNRRHPVAPMEITACAGKLANNNLAVYKGCTQTGFDPTVFPGQDALNARQSGVTPGTRFAVYDANGNRITTPQWVAGGKDGAGHDINYLSGDAACIQDTTTNLWWEVKKLLDPNTLSIHAEFLTFDRSLRLGGDANRYICETARQTLASCPIDYFVAQVNQQKLCGKTGWRLPTVEELRSLVVYDAVTIDESHKYFHDPNYFWWLSSGLTSQAEFRGYMSADSNFVGYYKMFFTIEPASPFPNPVLRNEPGNAMLVHD